MLSKTVPGFLEYEIGLSPAGMRREVAVRKRTLDGQGTRYTSTSAIPEDWVALSKMTV